MQSTLERIAGVGANESIDLRLRGRSVAGVGVVALLAGLSLAAAYLLAGGPIDAIIASLCAVGGPAAVVLWRFTRNRGLVLDFTLTWILALLGTGAVLTHGFAYLAWFSVLPIAAFFIGGLRGGQRWSIVVLGCVLAIVVHFVVSAPEPEATLPIQLLRSIGLPPTLAALGYLFERSRTRALQELDTARLAAIEANDARGRLLAKVSHEIRTPLNGVLGLTQSLLLQPLPAHISHDLDLIHQSGTGLVSLINDLLDLARAEAGKLDLHPAPVELVRLVHEVSGLHQAAAVQKGLELRVGGHALPMWVSTDEVRLRQVLGNLVANAVKFTDRGVVSVTLTTGKDEGGLVEVKLAVEDTGRGISPDGLTKLFQPFTQAHADLAHVGSGLGLAISHELTRNLGGQLSATSTPGHGSTFTVTLSLHRSALPERRTPTPQVLPSFHALVVDDNAMNRRVARALLERIGATTRDVADGSEALTAAQAGRTDIVFMDLQMPVMDGLTATRALREKGFSGAILALTASAGPETEAECLSAGMNGCLAKPLQLERLRDEVARVLKLVAAKNTSKSTIA